MNCVLLDYMILNVNFISAKTHLRLERIQIQNTEKYFVLCSLFSDIKKVVEDQQ